MTPLLQTRSRPARALFACLVFMMGCTNDHAPTICAAASLHDALRSAATDFRQSDGPELSLLFSGSHTLQLQIEEGAACDLFVSANATHVDELVAEGLLEEPVALASNRLALIVPRNEPRLQTFDDLPQATHIVVGQEQVPIGAYTERLLDAAGARLGSAFVRDVRARVDSTENNVRLVRAKVELGEADAGIVYASDVSDRVRAIAIPEELNVRTDVVAGLHVQASDEAQRFLAYLRSSAGQHLLAEHGFEAR